MSNLALRRYSFLPRMSRLIVALSIVGHVARESVREFLDTRKDKEPLPWIS